ncbi:MAG: hypothetical protein ACLP0J_16635 [Solirubrobacteraceae bacterium]
MRRADTITERRISERSVALIVKRRAQAAVVPPLSKAWAVAAHGPYMAVADLTTTTYVPRITCWRDRRPTRQIGSHPRRTQRVSAPWVGSGRKT